jgi:excinuclease ABC subunit C
VRLACRLRTGFGRGATQLPGESQSANPEASPTSAGWETLDFNPADPKATLSQTPQAAAVFALYGEDARAEPYIGRTPNLQSRLARLLQPSARHPRRLHLAGLVRHVRWRVTGSEFESLLLQFDLLQSQYGTKCLERMHLRHPAFVRFLGGNPYPRVVVTHRPGLREADWAYGPFPSRAAAERYAEEMLKLFLLRRCIDDLHPDPGFPGCVYSEMKMCLAPCFKGCSDERYAEEAAAVESFLATRGENRLVTLRAQRDQASATLAFESAAALHAQVQRVESVRALAAELVRPMSQLRAVILQTAAHSGEVAVFLFENGTLRGPAQFSTLGMRIQNEQSGSTSLFAQPLALEAVAEEQETEKQGTGNREQGSEGQGAREQESEGAEKQGAREQATPASKDISPGTPAGSEGAEAALKGHDFSRADERFEKNEGASAPEESARRVTIPRTLLESRLESVLATLAAPGETPAAATRQGHLALLKRWYYRPEVRRTGEIFFPDADNHWPIRSILRGIGRVAAKSITPLS